MVPGVRPCLQSLADRGVELTLASGTEVEFVRSELQLLELADFFGDRVFAPGSEPREFAKRRVMEELIARHQLPPTQLVSFGDGLVETQAVVALGGLAIGIACDETHRSGVIDLAKRDSLAAAGAAVIVGDYRSINVLLDQMWS
jgi:phosphoglycolate phosphatase